MKLSLTITGLFIAVGGTILTHLGFSDVCSNEIIANTPLAIGSVLAYIGRIRQGDVTIFGVKKSSV